MASLVKRGTRAAPQWHVKWTVQTAEGKPRQIWKRLHGVENQKQALKRLAEIEVALQKGEDPFPTRIEPTASQHLLEAWTKTLTNRNAATDAGVVRKHLIPRFGHLSLEKITLAEVRDWAKDMREGPLAAQTQKHLLGTLSRFWSWCIEEEQTSALNPVRSLPSRLRPVVVHKKRATLEDEAKLAKLIASLPPPVDLMLALANRTGARLGEVCGLRLSDLDDLDKGFILVSHSYGGPLKEDKRGEGKFKKIPAPIDAGEALKLHLARRKLQGAGPDDLVFVPYKQPRRKRTTDWLGFRKENIRDLWRAACEAVGLVDEAGKPTVTWYGATRTTAATRAAKGDVPVEQIADSLGHASRDVTTRHYIQHVRQDFDPALRLPMLSILAGGSAAPDVPASAPASKKVQAAKTK